MAMSNPVSLRDQVKLSVSSVLAAFPVGIPLHAFLREYKDLEGKHLPFRDLGFNSPADLLVSLSDVVHVIETSVGQKVVQGIPNKNSAHIYKFVQQQSTKANKSARKVKELLKHGGPTRVEYRNDDSRIKGRPIRETQPPVDVNEVERKIHNLLQCHPSGLPFSEIGPLFRERYGQNFSIGLEQFISMMAHMETLTVHKIANQGGAAYRIFRVSTRKTEPSPAGEQGIPNDVKLKVRKVVDAHCNGVNAQEFHSAYKTVHNEPLNVQLMGFPCLMEFLETLDGEVLRLDRSRPDWVEILPLPYQSKSQTVETSVSSSSSGRELGRNSGEKSGIIPREELPRSALEGNRFFINIGWVSHPENFWWTLAESTKAIMSLEHNMMNFYESPANQNLVLLTSEIKIGQLVAAKSPSTGRWQRAAVLSYAIEGRYAVRFVDHGDWQKVDLSHLRPLSSKFTDLPTQAKKSRLDGVRIPDCGWPDRILQSFKALLCGGPLEARCVAVEDGQEPCYVLELIKNNKDVAKEICGDGAEDPAEEVVDRQMVDSVKQIDISAGQRLHVIRLADEKPLLVSEELAALTRHKTLDALKTRLKEEYSAQVVICRRDEFPRVFYKLGPLLDCASAVEEIELLPLRVALQVLAFHGCSSPGVISLLKVEMK